MTITDLPGAAASVREETRDGRFYRHPNGDRLISMTNVGGSTDGTKKEVYMAWAAKLAAFAAVENLQEVLRILKENGPEEGPEAAVAFITEDARKRRELKRDAGSFVHQVLEMLILWAASPDGTGAEITFPELPAHLAGALYDGEPVEQVTDAMITGFMNFVTDFGVSIQASEMVVFNRQFGIAGTLDAIMGFPGRRYEPAGWLRADPTAAATLCVDFKSGREDIMTQEQVPGYRRCPEALLPMGEIAPTPRTDGGAVLYLRPEYERGYRLLIMSAADDAKGWNRFRRALELTTGRRATRDKPGRVAYPLLPDGTLPSPRTADLDGEGYGRVPGALARAGILDLDALAALDEAGCLALKGIGGKSLPIIRQILIDYGLRLNGDTPAPAATVLEEAA